MMAAATYNDSMDHLNRPADTMLSDDDVRACVHVLRAIQSDRSHLTRLSQEQRRELLTLAGLVANPERHDLVRMAKAFRRAEREAAKDHDRKVLEQAAARSSRRRHDGGARGSCTARRSRSGATSMTTFAMARRCFQRIVMMRIGSRSICARSTAGGYACTKLRRPSSWRCYS
jgi:hypothetical protein